jgi:hypothetical protein
MTVSSLAFSPRQWPAQPVNVSFEHTRKGLSKLTLKSTVAVGVVAAEEDVVWVSVDDDVVCSDGG